MKLYSLDEIVESGLEDGVFIPFNIENNEFLDINVQSISLNENDIEVQLEDDLKDYSLDKMCSLIDEYSYVFMKKENRGEDDEEL